MAEKFSNQVDKIHNSRAAMIAGIFVKGKHTKPETQRNDSKVNNDPSSDVNVPRCKS